MFLCQVCFCHSYYLEYSSLASPKDKISEVCMRAWKDDNPDELFVKAFNIPITRRDLQKLYYGCWLNDEIINFYFSLICDRSDKSNTLPKVTETSSSFILTTLRSMPSIHTSSPHSPQEATTVSSDGQIIRTSSTSTSSLYPYILATIGVLSYVDQSWWIGIMLGSFRSSI